MSGALPSEKDPGNGRAAALGQRTVGSLGWMMGNTAITRCASFLAQIALGWLLSEEDFGIYALAISIATIGALLRDAGVRQILVARQREYATLVGPVFWMAMAFNSAAGLLLAVAAPLAAFAYGEPSLLVLVLFIALAQPLSTPGAILATRLEIDMRFRALGIKHIGAAVIRYGGAVAFAWAGFGPLSFVLPLPFLAVYEAVIGWVLTRERPWERAAHLMLWRSLFTQARWVLAGSFAIALLNFGPNLAIGAFVQTAVVGLYFFAFQIIVQIGMLLSNNVNKVLLAALSKIALERERKRAAVARALRHLTLLSAPLCLGLAVMFPALELLIWQGKWAAATPAIQAFGILYAFAILPSVAHAAQQARGEFRGAAAGLLVLGAITIGATAVGTILVATPLGIAAAMSLGRAIGSMGYVAWALRPLGIRARTVLGAVGPAWLSALAAAGIGVTIDMSLVEWHPLVRLIVVGGAFGGSYLVLARIFLRASLLDLLTTTHGRPANIAAQVLLLPRPAPRQAGATTQYASSSA